LFSPKLLLISAIAVALVGSTFTVSSFYASAQDNGEKVVNGGHGLGYYQTTGDVLDPIGADGSASTGVDPMEYLRSFNYGRVSTLEDETVLREFTMVADDRQPMEVSPGVYYNVWTFNGTIPGPTFRATEGDLIRINFLNNGSHPHSIHTHGIHKAEMDGVFEIINPGGRFIYEFYAEQVSIFAFLGTYVGVIPVLIGLLWYPFIKRLSQNKYNFFLSLTAGLLLFLGIDAIVDTNEIVTANLAGAFQGQLLIATAAIVSFLALMYVSERLVDGAKGRVIKGSFAIALMVAIGIGMHNLGEGLAIGGAMVLGEVALSTFLIVGFTLHNTTEGLAIVAPMAR